MQNDLSVINDLFKSSYNNENERWMLHSIHVAALAHFITLKTDNDVNLAFTCGLLHDIGRIENKSFMHHIILGYKLLLTLNKVAACVCLTHSFPLKNASYYQGFNNCSSDEYIFLVNFLDTYNYSYYDKLIQLCDAIGNSDGFCKIEERLKDVISRAGKKSFTPIVQNAYLHLKSSFDDLLSCDMYDIAFSKDIMDFSNYVKDLYLPGISRKTG
jgi:putative nucleotidyltransferase with HDIG domain